MKALSKPIMMVLGLILAMTSVDNLIGESKSDTDRIPNEARDRLRQERRKATLLDIERRVANELGWQVRTGAEKRILTALSAKVELAFIDRPLNEVLNEIARDQKIRILLDDVALSEEAISSDEAINLNISGVKLGSALRITLEPLALSYIIEDGVLKVTTESNKRRLGKPVVRVYDVSRLMKSQADAKALAAAVQQTIANSEKAAEPTGQVTAFRHLLIARTTHSGHDKILRILDLLQDGLAAGSSNRHGNSRANE